MTSTVVGIGEILWDLLPDGARLGGAPFNACVHLRRLGFEAAIVSAVGDDEPGRRALVEAHAHGVRTGLVDVVPGVPTGTVAVALGAGGHARYAFTSPVAYERRVSDPVAGLRGLGLRPAALVFGTLAQQFPPVRAATRALVGAFPDAIRVYDVNLRQGGWSAGIVDELLRDATVLKLNTDEVRVLGAALDLPATGAAEFAVALAARYGTRVVCVTDGAAGATAWSDGEAVSVPGIRVDVVDTVGAGDAFTAAFIGALLRGRALHDAVRGGNALGALVASRAGATPAWTAADLEACP